MNQYTIDRNRVVVHGMGVGGQMAFRLGFRARDVVRGHGGEVVLDRSPMGGLRAIVRLPA